MAQDGELRLHLRYELEDLCPVVFRKLTDPQELARWWGPDGFSTPSVEIDLRPGGAYRIAMQPPEGELFHLVGEFIEVDPPGRPVVHLPLGGSRPRGPGDGGDAVAVRHRRQTVRAHPRPGRLRH
ncbi:SRPBCC family protein [Streptomyces purpurascens]